MSLQDYIDELTMSLDFAESVEQWECIQTHIEELEEQKRSAN